jgi:hypothetical protein
MKKILYITTILLSVTLTACLKDKGQSADYYDANDNTIIEFVEATQNPNAPATSDDPPTQPVVASSSGFAMPTIEEFSIARVRLGGFVNGNRKDIKYSIAVNNALVNEYNIAHESEYILFPAGSLTLTGLEGTVPVGTDEVTIKLKVNKSLLSLTESYAVGLIINSSDAVINNNANKILLNFSIRNKYDGVYKLRVKTTGWATYGITDGVTADYPLSASGLGIGLVTNGASSNGFFNYFRGDDLLPAFGVVGSALSPTAFGATTPKFTFDDATNRLINVENTTPNDGRNRTLLLNPAITDSRYDPATKTIYAAFIMTQNGRPNQFFYDTLTYIGPRP